MESIKRDFGRFNFQDSLMTELVWDGAVLGFALQVCEWQDEDDRDVVLQGDGELQFIDTELLSAAPPLEDDIWGHINDCEILALHHVAKFDAGRAHGMELIVHLPPALAATTDEPVLILTWRSKGFVWIAFD